MMKFILLATVASAAKFGAMLEQATTTISKIKQQLQDSLVKKEKEVEQKTSLEAPTTVEEKSIEEVTEELIKKPVVEILPQPINTSEFAKKLAMPGGNNKNFNIKPIGTKTKESGKEMKKLFEDLDLNNEIIGVDRIGRKPFNLAPLRKGRGYLATHKKAKTDYNNKNLFFVTELPTCPAENSCYGATHEKVCCKSCRAVHESYKAQGWSFEAEKISQCLDEPQHCGVNSCYGAKEGCCNTCDDVVKAYQERYWAYDLKNFGQCISEGRLSGKTYRTTPRRTRKEAQPGAVKDELAKKLKGLENSMKQKLEQLSEPEMEILYV